VDPQCGQRGSLIDWKDSVGKAVEKATWLERRQIALSDAALFGIRM
jgi:hypothetical protein